MNIKKAAIIGGGIMGRQIAMNTAIYNYQVDVFDVKAAARDSVLRWADEYLAGRLAKGRMTEETVSGIKDRFHVSETMEEAVKDADLVIEAVVERKDVKLDVFRQLSDLCRKDTILASNSSYMVSSEFKEAVSNPGRLLNMHYSNPALVMKLLEVCRGEHTDEETVQAAMEFGRSTGKTPVLINKEIDGFLLNRIFNAISSEARKLVEEGYCSYEDMDLVCEKGLGHPKGPFRVNDLTGLDLTLDVMERMYKESGEKPCCYDLYKKMVDEGFLGVKSGKGFYDYEK